MTRLSLWTVYDHPRDFPHNYVAREWIVENGKLAPTANLMLSPDLERLRQQLPMHLHRIPRSEGDDPKIVETWL